MKTEKELNSDILKITMKIAATHPELSKFTAEMPIATSAPGAEIDIKALEDYYSSLVDLLKKYDISHTDEK